MDRLIPDCIRSIQKREIKVRFAKSQGHGNMFRAIFGYMI